MESAISYGSGTRPLNKAGTAVRWERGGIYWHTRYALPSPLTNKTAFWTGMQSEEAAQLARCLRLTVGLGTQVKVTVTGCEIISRETLTCRIRGLVGCDGKRSGRGRRVITAYQWAGLGE